MAGAICSIWNQWSISVNPDTPTSSATRAVAASVGAIDSRGAGEVEADVVDADMHDGLLVQVVHGPTPPMRSAVMWMTWPGGGLSNGRELHARAEVDLGELLEQLGAAALDEPGGAVHDEVVVEADLVAALGLDRERNRGSRSMLRSLRPWPRWAHTISSPSTPTHTMLTCGLPSGFTVTR